MLFTLFSLLITPRSMYHIYNMWIGAIIRMDMNNYNLLQPKFLINLNFQKHGLVTNSLLSFMCLNLWFSANLRFWPFWLLKYFKDYIIRINRNSMTHNWWFGEYNKKSNKNNNSCKTSLGDIIHLKIPWHQLIAL